MIEVGLVERITEDDIARAIANDELHLVFQPKKNMLSGATQCVEALTRWNHPELGAIPPALFIPIAEQCGLIRQITNWVIQTSLKQWQIWARLGFPVEIAINISALNLSEYDYPDWIEHQCALHGVPPRYIAIELTESARQSQVKLMDNITRFRLKGMKVALDDFGTGYATLEQLLRLPFSEIKIDRCFTSQVFSRDSSVITRAIINVAHELGIAVTAEGIEDQRTYDEFQTLKCDHAQGYFIGHPMTSQDLCAWLQATCTPPGIDDEQQYEFSPEWRSPHRQALG